MPNPVADASHVNDFVVKFANVNGTGSASANSLIMKAIFRMGVPVTGKNYFPSNIQGLPTWYEIRVTRDGYAARARQVDIMVAMNAETYSKDVREVNSGGYLIYDSTWPRSALLQRGDITVIAVPLARLVNENFDGVRNRILLKNIAYAGVLAALLDVDLKVIDGLLSESYGKKPKLLDSNSKALSWAMTTCAKPRVAAAAARRAHGQDPRPHHDRRQHRRRPGLCLRGRDRRRLVSDHALDLADGCLQGLLRALPRRPGHRRAQFRHAAGGGRTGRGRHGARCFLERRARLHADQRPRHLLDERIRGSGLLRRSTVRDLRRAARWPVHRHADPHAAGRHHAVRLRLARRYAPRAAVPGEPGGVLLYGGAGLRSGGAPADPGLRAVGSGHRHERLDVPGLEVGRGLPARPRQGVDARKKWPRSTSSTATSTATRMRLPPAPCRASSPRALTSRAARATTSTAATRRIRPNTRRCSTG